MYGSHDTDELTPRSTDAVRNSLSVHLLMSLVPRTHVTSQLSPAYRMSAARTREFADRKRRLVTVRACSSAAR